MLYRFLPWVLGITFLFLLVDVRSQRRCGQQRMPKVHSNSPWPWMVAISVKGEYNSDYSHYCSGFLIDHLHVITAAHCLNEKNLTEYQAHIGHVDRTRGKKYSIVKMVIHDNYTGGRYYNNIGIMTLDRPVTEPGFNPVCLPMEEIRRLNLDNERAALVGWGRNPFGDILFILQQLKGMPVISNKQCELVYRMAKKSSEGRDYANSFPTEINSKMMCVGGRHTCDADSGAALMIQRNNSWFAIGIHIFGIGCGSSDGKPAGFTRVSEYLEWIWENAFKY